jgi:hypothetical protein
VGIEAGLRREVRMKKAPTDLSDLEFFRKVAEKQGEVGRKLVYLLNTGNLVRGRRGRCSRASLQSCGAGCDYPCVLGGFRPRWG